MKIALVNNYYYLRGGSERVLYHDRDALLAAGHEVLPFVPSDKRNDQATSADFFPIVTDHTRIGALGALKAASNLIYSPAVGRAFAAFLDSFQPDVIHCHNVYGRLTTSVLDAARQRGIPTVLTVHDLKLVCPAYLGVRQSQPCLLCQDGGYWRCVRWKCHKQSLVPSLVYSIESYFNRFLRKYDTVQRFLCPSRFVERVLIDSGIPSSRTEYHPNALHLESYEPRVEPGDYVLYAGRLSVEKGLKSLLAASKQMNIPIRIAGIGPLESEIRAIIEAENLPVRMEGYCSGEHLAQLFQGAAFTVVPSEWYENASMAILESFAYGKPVLAADIGGNPELVLAGETGLLVPSSNPERLAEAGALLWSDRARLRRMGTAARHLMEQNFSQKMRLSRLLSIYYNVISNRTAPAP